MVIVDANVLLYAVNESATVVEPTSRHLEVLRGLLLQAGTGGNIVNDAHWAALCVEYGARLCSFDRDFDRFPGVKVIVPGSSGA
jgi:predicted nucleic acid-binding protein